MFTRVEWQVTLCDPIQPVAVRWGSIDNYTGALSFNMLESCCCQSCSGFMKHDEILISSWYLWPSKLDPFSQPGTVFHMDAEFP